MLLTHHYSVHLKCKTPSRPLTEVVIALNKGCRSENSPWPTSICSGRNTSYLSEDVSLRFNNHLCWPVCAILFGNCQKQCPSSELLAFLLLTSGPDVLCLHGAGG
jgi:hypothetical protein